MVDERKYPTLRQLVNLGLIAVGVAWLAFAFTCYLIIIYNGGWAAVLLAAVITGLAFVTGNEFE